MKFFKQSPAKITARINTILTPYRKLFGTSLPMDKQYWTMCGRLTKNDHSEDKLSEFNQMVRRGLIIPEQFYGVEIDKKINVMNKCTHPHLNLVNGDFFNVMIKYASEKNFNPGIIYADMPFMHERAASYFCNIIELLKQINANNVMVVLNYMRNNPLSGKEYDANALIEEIVSNQKWHYASEGLEWSEEVYDYVDRKNKMCTFLFWKK